MTVCAAEAPVGKDGAAGHTSFVIAADGSYGARLVRCAGSGGWIPERWTLNGPEPYAVPLPGDVPEAAGARLLPLADGRVLIARREAGALRLALLYPTGPDTGELPLGAVEAEGATLLPPTPRGRTAYALVPRAGNAEVWQLAGGADGPERVAEVSGRCSGGVWLDDEARLLALDRAEGPGARAKTVVVDLGRGGEVSPLLEITEDSEDRLLLADPGSGLVLLTSDAPGRKRLGWGVLGSSLPVRFPEALAPGGVRLTPLAVQPGQVLTPEGCAVALRADGPNGTWVALWRPAQRSLRHVPAPHGWLTGSGWWTAEGELRLPYVHEETECGVARLPLPPQADADAGRFASVPGARGDAREDGTGFGPAAEARPPTTRPVPLQQAPMARGQA